MLKHLSRPNEIATLVNDDRLPRINIGPCDNLIRIYSAIRYIYYPRRDNIDKSTARGVIVLGTGRRGGGEGGAILSCRSHLHMNCLLDNKLLRLSRAIFFIEYSYLDRLRVVHC